MTSQRSAILNNKNAWSIVLDYCGESQVSDLKNELKHQGPKDLTFLQEATQDKLHLLGVERTRLLMDLFNQPHFLHGRPPLAGWQNYLACYKRHSKELLIFIMLYVTSAKDLAEICKRANLPLNLKDHIPAIIQMLAEDPKNKEILITFQLYCLQNFAVDKARLFIENGATPPDFCELAKFIYVERSSLKYDVATIRLMESIFRHYKKANDWFLQNSEYRVAHIIQTILGARIHDSDYSLYEHHVSRLLKLHDLRPFADLIYRLLFDSIFAALAQPYKPMYGSFFGVASPYVHRRIGHKSIINACKMIDFLIKEHDFPVLITPKMAEMKNLPIKIIEKNLTSSGHSKNIIFNLLGVPEVDLSVNVNWNNIFEQIESSIRKELENEHGARYHDISEREHSNKRLQLEEMLNAIRLIKPRQEAYDPHPFLPR
ncbi:MAG: hypothetical protein ACYCQI_10785 [Gammaproteobacteria bacterium]